MAKILLIEDDTTLSAMIADVLRHDGHDIDGASDGGLGLEKVVSGQYDLVILDWHLPSMSGIDICHEARRQGVASRILMLTSASGLSDSESGLDAGADDYLTKPFAMLELVARIKALLRRPQELIPNELHCADVVLFVQPAEVFKGGVKLDLRPAEYSLLEFLLRHRGTVFSSEDLLDRVWHSDAEVGYDAVSTCVKRLRAKIDTDGNTSIIKTIHSVGYLIE